MSGADGLEQAIDGGRTDLEDVMAGFGNEGSVVALVEGQPQGHKGLEALRAGLLFGGQPYRFDDGQDLGPVAALRAGRFSNRMAYLRS